MRATAGTFREASRATRPRDAERTPFVSLARSTRRRVRYRQIRKPWSFRQHGAAPESAPFYWPPKETVAALREFAEISRRRPIARPVLPQDLKQNRSLNSLLAESTPWPSRHPRCVRAPQAGGNHRQEHGQLRCATVCCRDAREAPPVAASQTLHPAVENDQRASLADTDPCDTDPCDTEDDLSVQAAHGRSR